MIEVAIAAFELAINDGVLPKQNEQSAETDSAEKGV